MIMSVPAALADIDGFARHTAQITPHVRLIYRPVATDAPYEGNSVVTEQSDGLVVVDAGGSPPAERNIVEQIRTFSARDQLKRPELSPATRAGWQQMADVDNSMVAGYTDLKAYPATLPFGGRLTIPLSFRGRVDQGALPP